MSARSYRVLRAFDGHTMGDVIVVPERAASWIVARGVLLPLDPPGDSASNTAGTSFGEGPRGVR